ncbi:MAG: hypothetical protein JRJ84_12225 [Deltaproteobacteria bacterium]|nr:hypothetical protein [Deltaproteobacteria bacterium]
MNVPYSRPLLLAAFSVLFALPSCKGRDDTAETGDTGSEVPPLYFVYGVHLHVSDPFLPYTDPSMGRLDGAVAANMLDVVQEIRNSADAVGLKVTWEVTQSSAKGLCELGGAGHVLGALVADGHEVGVHGHRLDHVAPTFAELQVSCGITANTNSGYVAMLGSMAAPTDVALDLLLKDQLALGMTVGTANFSPHEGNPLQNVCGDDIGLDDPPWEQTHNLLFPYKPDHLSGDLCAHSDDALVVIVDHTNPDWMLVDGGAPPDVLGPTEFGVLQEWFDAAIAYQESARPERLAAWGFVTHITEYAVGGDGEHGTDPAGIAALDAFLAHVDEQAQQGRVAYATASEIAALAWPE